MREREPESRSSTAKAEPATNSQSQKFPRTSRLTKHAEFERAYKSGRKIFSALMTVFYLDSAACKAPARVGFTVSKAFGGAVTRNLMKRRLRAAARKYLGLLPAGLEVVVHPKKSALGVNSEKIHGEMERAFRSIAAGKGGKH